MKKEKEKYYYYENEDYYSGPQYEYIKKNYYLTTSLGELAVDEIYFYENGSVYMYRLSEEVEFSTPTGNFIVQNVGFYPNGQVLFLTLSQPQFIESSLGIISIREILFYSSGKPYIVNLAQRLSVGKKSYPAGTLLGFDEDGKFIGQMRYNEKKGIFEKAQ